MKTPELQLPSNRNTGVFFTGIFLLLSLYLFWTGQKILGSSFAVVSLVIALITLINDRLLLPLNKLWMQFGLLLGMIFQPILLGILFFGLFTPIAWIMKIVSRDELRIKPIQTDSFWRKKEPASMSFEQQF